MLARTVTQYIVKISLVFVLLTACGGGGDMNFNVGGNNWPWPWLNNADVFAHKTITENITVDDHNGLWLDGVNGVVEIIGQPGGGSLMMTARARVGSDTFMDAQAGLDHLDVSIIDGGDEITVKTVQPQSSQGRQYIVDYTIFVPSALIVNVNQVNGHVTLNDIDTSIFVVLENGNVDLGDIHGNASVSVANGSVIGDIFLPPDGEAVISTVNGDIDLGIPSSTSAELFGQVNIGTISWDNLALLDVTSTNKSLQGTLGDGDGLIDLTTVNGSIVITGL